MHHLFSAYFVINACALTIRPIMMINVGFTVYVSFQPQPKAENCIILWQLMTMTFDERSPVVIYKLVE